MVPKAYKLNTAIRLVAVRRNQRYRVFKLPISTRTAVQRKKPEFQISYRNSGFFINLLTVSRYFRLENCCPVPQFSAANCGIGQSRIADCRTMRDCSLLYRQPTAI